MPWVGSLQARYRPSLLLLEATSALYIGRQLHRGATAMPTGYRGRQRHYTILSIIKRDRHGTPRVGRCRDGSKGRDPCTRQHIVP